MEAPQSGQAFPTVTLDNGTVLALTEDQLSAMMALVQAPRVPEGPPAELLHMGAVSDISAIALNNGQYPKMMSQSLEPNQSQTTTMASPS
ncbi:MAG: hypothetical protein M1835_006533, partial [Candelina submexicana]